MLLLKKLLEIWLDDWLLVYEIDNGELILYLTRTGSRSDPISALMRKPGHGCYLIAAASRFPFNYLNHQIRP